MALFLFSCIYAFLMVVQLAWVDFQDVLDVFDTRLNLPYIFHSMPKLLNQAILYVTFGAIFSVIGALMNLAFYRFAGHTSYIETNLGDLLVKTLKFILRHWVFSGLYILAPFAVAFAFFKAAIIFFQNSGEAISKREELFLQVVYLVIVFAVSANLFLAPSYYYCRSTGKSHGFWTIYLKNLKAFAGSLIILGLISLIYLPLYLGNSLHLSNDIKTWLNVFIIPATIFNVIIAILLIVKEGAMFKIFTYSFRFIINNRRAISVFLWKLSWSGFAVLLVGWLIFQTFDNVLPAFSVILQDPTASYPHENFFINTTDKMVDIFNNIYGILSYAVPLVSFVLISIMCTEFIMKLEQKSQHVA